MQYMVCKTKKQKRSQLQLQPKQPNCHSLWEIRPKVCSLSDTDWMGTTLVAYFNQRASLGVPLTKQQKIKGMCTLWKHHQITLQEPRTLPIGGSSKVSFSTQESKLLWLVAVGCCMEAWGIIIVEMRQFFLIQHWRRYHYFSGRSFTGRS